MYRLILCAATLLAFGVAAAPAASDDRQMCRGGASDEEIAACSRVIAQNPKDAFAFRNRAFSYARKGEYDLAIADYDQAIKLTPKDDIAYTNRGDAYLDKGEYDHAIADFTQAIRLNPKNAGNGYDRRGQALGKKGDLDHAIADLDRAIKLFPNYANFYKHRGDIFRAKGDHDSAIADYDQAIRLDPKYIDAYNSRGDTYEAKGDHADALAVHDEARKIAAAPVGIDDRITCINGTGDEAIAACGNLIRQTSNNVVVSFLYGSTVGHFDQATAYTWRGKAYFDKADYDRAIADYDQAIRLKAGYTDAYKSRGDAYEAKGDHARALADYNQALLLDPTLVDARQDRDRVQSALTSQQNPAKPLASIPQPDTFPVTPPQPNSPPITPERRVALVIGNSAYRSVPALPNPRRDATAVAEALRQAGFQTVELAVDLDRDAVVKALRVFRAKADSADWALVYFAGHGIEINGTNYVIPVDAKLDDDRDVTTDAVSYEELLQAVRDAKALRLIVLDACRINPFRERMHRSIALRDATNRGLKAPPETEPGTLTVFSAKEGDVAEDGDGVNSPFTRAFVDQLKVPGVEVRRVFDNVRDEVIEATRRRQQPFTYGSLPGRKDFFFVSAK
jgi:tetratricopeptide (TPR) repeat protein